MSSSTQKYFLAISLFFGLIYVFLIPPFQAPDEDNHFFRCYQLATPTPSQESSPSDRLGGVLPSSLQDYAQQFEYLRFNYEGKISYDGLNTFNEQKMDKVNMRFVDFSNTAMYFPSSYLSHIPIMAMASRSSMKPSALLYLMRVVSLLTWILVVIWAFKFHESELLFYITLLPSLLVLHSSVTADVVSNSIAFFLTAYIFHLRKQKELISVKQILFFAIPMIILSVNKIAYLPLVLLWFLLPFGKCLSKGRYYTTFLLIAISCILLTGLWANRVNDNYITYENYDPEYRESQQIKPNGDPVKQTKYVLLHPVEFTMNMVKSYLSVAQATVAHLTGKFGWEKNYLPWWMIGLLAINLLLIILSTKEGFVLRDKLWMLIIVLSTLSLLAVIMYGIYSAVGNDYVHNLGGKYLIPIFPLMAFLFSTKLVQKNWSQKITIPILLLAHVTMLYSILARYYF